MEGEGGHGTVQENQFDKQLPMGLGFHQMSTEPILKVTANKNDKMSDGSSSEESSSESDDDDDRIIQFDSSDDNDEEQMMDVESSSLTTKSSKKHGKDQMSHKYKQGKPLDDQ